MSGRFSTRGVVVLWRGRVRQVDGGGGEPRGSASRQGTAPGRNWVERAERFRHRLIPEAQAARLGADLHDDLGEGSYLGSFNTPSCQSKEAECGPSARLVHLLATLLKETAERASQRSDYRDRPDLHEDVEDSSARRDRILDLRGDGQQLRCRPEHGAAECFDLGLLGMALEKERRDRAEQVNTDSHQDDRHEVIPQPTMRGRRRTENVTKLAGSGPQHSKRHRSIVAGAPDVCAAIAHRRHGSVDPPQLRDRPRADRAWTRGPLAKPRPGGRPPRGRGREPGRAG
jgi:hypothetical protein